MEEKNAVIFVQHDGRTVTEVMHEIIRLESRNQAWTWGNDFPMTMKIEVLGWVESQLKVSITSISRRKKALDRESALAALEAGKAQDREQAISGKTDQEIGEDWLR